MSNVNVFNRSFLRGLETTRDETGAPDWSGFRLFRNVRVDKDQAERRPGRALVATIADAGKAAKFIGNHAVIAPREDVWALARFPNWCLEFLLKSDDTGTDGELLDAGSVVVEQKSGDWVVSIGTAQLLTAASTAAHHLAVTRTSAGYALLKDGVQVDADPYVAPGAVAASQIWLGDMSVTIDFVRLRSFVPATWKQRELRLLNPRAEGVLACYEDVPDANSILWDRSVYEAHGLCGTMGTPADRLSEVPHAPVQGIGSYVDENDVRQLFVVANGKEYAAPYG